MKKCDWKKVKRRSLSLSEWQCGKCSKIGYGSHEKPPVNCLQTSFGVGIASNRINRQNIIEKITASKLGNLSLSFVFFISLIVIVTAFSQFKCTIYSIFNYESTVCSSVDLINDIYADDFADGLVETDAVTNLCTGVEYVDYEDVNEYLKMLRSEMQFLDNAISTSHQKYAENYSVADKMSAERKEFFNEKIAKCFGGDDGRKLVREVARMQRFVEEKKKALYDLAYK